MHAKEQSIVLSSFYILVCLYFVTVVEACSSHPSGSMNLSICSHTHQTESQGQRGESLFVCVCVCVCVAVAVYVRVFVSVCVIHKRFLNGWVCSQFTYKVWTGATRLQLPP